MVAIQVQIQALLIRGTGGEAVVEVSQPNTGSNVDVAKLPTFNENINISKILYF